MRRAVPFCLLMLTLVAAPQAQTPVVKMDGYPAPGETATVKLLSAGAGPKKLLRLKLSPTLKQHVDTTVNMTMSMEVAGQSMPMDLPPQAMGMDLAVTGVAPNGDATVLTTMTGAPGSPMASVSFTVTMTDRGVQKSMTMDTSKVADPTAKAVLDQISSAITLSSPLPEEEVGVGAKWEVRQAVKANGMQLFQRSEFEVVSMEGNSVTLKSTTTQTAPAQDFALPGMPAGVDAQLTSLTGTGSGTTTLMLDGLANASAATQAMNMTMSMQMGGQSQAMAMTMTIKTASTPKK